ncbi:hypothetical protein Lal_00021356 [Lupinus albus]|nr:hypothetical protein Lal_00021356 [Lupinus albus]
MGLNNQSLRVSEMMMIRLEIAREVNNRDCNIYLPVLYSDLWYPNKTKVQYGLKAKNILTSVVGINEFFRVSNCKFA